jgi:hypothetical protein
MAAIRAATPDLAGAGADARGEEVEVDFDMIELNWLIKAKTKQAQIKAKVNGQSKSLRAGYKKISN